LHTSGADEYHLLLFFAYLNNFFQ